MCKVLEVSRSGYYSYLKSRKKTNGVELVELMALVKEIHRESKGAYGSRRMSRGLRERGYDIGRYRARTLMKMAGVSVKSKKRYKVTTDSRHGYPVAPNILNRQFDVAAPDRVWVSDITYLWTKEGWMYLAVVMDLYSRKIVGWSIDKRMTQELAKNALIMASGRRKPGDGLIHHSDRGSQYAAYAYQDLLVEHSMICSMSRKGDCWDNAVIESFFGTLKRERVHLMRYETRMEAKKDIVDYIEMFYNCRRLHSYLGYVSPNQFEKGAILT